jgi:hypothetical protein
MLHIKKILVDCKKDLKIKNSMRVLILRTVQSDELLPGILFLTANRFSVYLMNLLFYPTCGHVN